jgi:hypothetical protein
MLIKSRSRRVCLYSVIQSVDFESCVTHLLQAEAHTRRPAYDTYCGVLALGVRIRYQANGILQFV